MLLNSKVLLVIEKMVKVIFLKAQYHCIIINVRFKTTVMKTIKTKAFEILICLLIIAIAGCGKDDGPEPVVESIPEEKTALSSEKQITSFVFLTKDTSFPVDLVATLDQENNMIEALVPSDADVSNLLPEIKISNAATIDKTNAQNFTEPVLYTVSAEDGTTNSYTVSVKPTSIQKIALKLILENNPENTLNWDLKNTIDSELGNLDGVTIDGDGLITGLFLDSKNISELPPEIILLSSLELLKLDDNPITELPVEIGQLTALTEISLKETQLNAIPAEIGLLTNLNVLLIKGNPITTLPPQIGLLKNLSRLDLVNNEITSLPPEMGFLSNLNFLIVEESNLAEIPTSLAFLTTLNEFIGLSVLPTATIVSSKDALISIYSANPENTLEWEVDNFPDIDFDDDGNPTLITINNKNLNQIPLTISSLSSLETLNANGNNLENLPATLATINTLSVITVANNNLSTVPSEFGILNNLALLSLTGNPITSIPQEVCDLQTSNGGILTILTDPGKGCN